LKPKVRKLIEWLARTSPLLESQIIASGLSSALNEALRDGLADMGPHNGRRDRAWEKLGRIDSVLGVCCWEFAALQ
jgi:hypothetical protein